MRLRYVSYYFVFEPRGELLDRIPGVHSISYKGVYVIALFRDRGSCRSLWKPENKAVIQDVTEDVKVVRR